MHSKCQWSSHTPPPVPVNVHTHGSPSPEQPVPVPVSAAPALHTPECTTSHTSIFLVATCCLAHLASLPWLNLFIHEVSQIHFGLRFPPSINLTSPCLGFGDPPYEADSSWHYTSDSKALPLTDHSNSLFFNLSHDVDFYFCLIFLTSCIVCHGNHGLTEA